TQDDLKINGHAIESRIYAEDPENNFLPSTGKIIEYIEPSGPGVRVDGGTLPGSEISLYYDPLISKLICYSKDRISAINIMKRALSEYHISGLITNIYFLSEIFNRKDFCEGSFDINYVDRNYQNLKRVEKEISETEYTAALLSAILKKETGVNNKLQNQSFPVSMNKWLEQDDE
ncbi:MAG: biotin carboxylase, partial [Ignavibacteriales bacterium]